MLTGISIAAMSLITTGCFDKSELEEQAFVVTLGISQKAKLSPIVLTARVAVPSKLTGSSGGGGGGSGDFQSGTPVVTASGRTIHEALSLMNTGVERTINLSHVAAILFGQRTASHGLLPYLRTLVRYREFRRTLYMFVTQGRMGEVFLKDKPVLEISATRMIEDLHDSSKRTGYAPSVELQQFLGRLDTPNEDPILPVLGYNKQVGEEKKKSVGNPRNLQPNRVTYLPGKTNRAGGNPVECVGTAVFRGDRMVGILSGEETRYLQLLSGASKRISIDLEEPSGSRGYITLNVRYAEPIRINVLLRGAVPQIHIVQSFEAELMGDQTGQSYVQGEPKKQLESKLSLFIKQRESELIHKVYTKMQADPFLYFSYARGQFPNHAAMARYNWRKQLANVQVHINTKATLRRLGTQLDPPVEIDTKLGKIKS